MEICHVANSIRDKKTDSDEEEEEDIFDFGLNEGALANGHSAAESTPLGYRCSSSILLRSREETVELSSLEDSDLFEGLSSVPFTEPERCERNTPLNRRLSDIIGLGRRPSGIFPSLGRSPNVRWTSAFLTPSQHSTLRSGAPLSNTLSSRSPLKRHAKADQFTPARTGAKFDTNPSYRSRWESSAHRPGNHCRPRFPEDLSPLKLDERMEDVEANTVSEMSTELSMEEADGDPKTQTVSGKENRLPPVSGDDWGDFDIGCSQEAEMAEHLANFEKALDVGGDATLTVIQSNVVDDAEGEIPDPITGEAADVPEPQPQLSLSSQLKDFFEGDDEELEAGFLSAACELEEEQYKKEAASPAPDFPCVAGFQTAAGRNLTVMSKEAEERARKLWASCGADESEAAAAAALSESDPPLPAALTKSGLRKRVGPAGTSFSAAPGPVLVPASEVGFTTASGAPLTFSQAAFDKYARIYDAEDDNDDESDVGGERGASVGRPDSPPEVGVGQPSAAAACTRLTRSSLAKPSPSPSTSSDSNKKAVTNFVTKDPKLARAAKIFEDIEGFDELLSQDFTAAGPRITPAGGSGTSFAEASAARGSADMPSKSAARPSPAVAAGPSRTPAQASGQKKSLFASFMSECKDLNFGMVRTFGSDKVVANGTPAGKIGVSSSKLSVSVDRGGAPKIGECSSTPRGLFRSAYLRHSESDQKLAKPFDVARGSPEIASCPSAAKPAILRRPSPPAPTASTPDRLAISVTPVADRVPPTAVEVGDGAGGGPNGGKLDFDAECDDDDFEASEEFLLQLRQMETAATEVNQADGDVVAASPVLPRRSGSGTKRKLSGRKEEQGGSKRTCGGDGVGTSSLSSDGGATEIRPCPEEDAAVAEPSLCGNPTEEDADRPRPPSKKTGSSSSTFSTGSTAPTSVIPATSTSSDAGNEGSVVSESDPGSDPDPTAVLDLSLFDRPPSPVVSKRRSVPATQRTEVPDSSRVVKDGPGREKPKPEPELTEEGHLGMETEEVAAPSPVIKRRTSSKRVLSRRRRSNCR